MVAGQVDLTIAAPPSLLGFIKDGRLRVLATGSDTRRGNGLSPGDGARAPSDCRPPSYGRIGDGPMFPGTRARHDGGWPVSPRARRAMHALPNPQLEQVFGRSRRQMPTATGVEVFREAAAPGARLRYTKRFLVTPRGDLRGWAWREGRILGRLAANGVRCIPALAGFDGEAGVVQTFDAGVTVEQWATLVPVERNGAIVPHVFTDCAHWWALAHYTLRALEALHRAGVVHLGVKPDNLCVPVLPADVDVGAPGATLGLQFARLAFIDFAFSLLATEPLATSLPLVAETGKRYQSRRFLQALDPARSGDLGPLNALDWRCDLYSLSAMLRLYRPAASATLPYLGWTAERHEHAEALLAALDEAHVREAAASWPHEALIEMCEAGMQEPDLVDSLIQGFTLAPVDAPRPVVPSTLLTDLAPVETAMAEDRGPQPETTVAAVPVDFPRVLRKRAEASAAAGSAEEGVVAELAPRQVSAPEQPAMVVAESPRIAPVVDDPIRVPSVVGPSPVSGMRQRRPRPRATLALAAAAVVVVALGLALAAHHQLPGERRSTASVAPATSAPRSVARNEVANHAALTEGGKSTASVDKGASGKVASRDLPIDAATVQHAASAAGSASVREPSPQAAPPMPVEASRVADAANASPPDAASPSAPSGSGADVQTQDGANPPPGAVALAQAPSDRGSNPSQAEAPRRASANAPSTTPDRERTDTASVPRDAAKVASATKTAPSPPRPTPANNEDRMQAVIPAGALEDVAARTERDVARVLTVAARADGPAAEQHVVELARSMRSVNAGPHAPTESPALARSLNAQARAAWERDDVQRALALQQRAFRANPNDPEVAGNLAYFYLKVRPAKPALARQLALYALAARGRSFPAGRAQDWGTLAIASALDGREADAVKAMYVMSSVSRDPERACRAAQLAVEQYGPAMRAPGRAMMARMRARGVTSHAPSCR